MMTTIMSNGDNEGDDDSDACHDSDDDDGVYLSWRMEITKPSQDNSSISKKNFAVEHGDAAVIRCIFCRVGMMVFCT